jgi:hypothetical protein
MLSVIYNRYMLSVVMLNVIMLNVVAPSKVHWLCRQNVSASLRGFKDRQFKPKVAVSLCVLVNRKKYFVYKNALASCVTEEKILLK